MAPYQREAILGKTRDLIATDWDKANTDGIGPDASAPLDLTVHTRGHDSKVGNPQVALTLVDETPSGIGIAGDGTGPVFDTDGLLQAACIAGSHERLDAAGIDESPSDVAYRMAQEVKRIWHTKAPTGLVDGSGELEYDGIRPAQVRPLPNAQRETNPATHGFLVELQYDYSDKTP